MPLPEFLAGESRRGQGQGDQPGGRDRPPSPHPKTLSQADWFRACVPVECEGLEVGSLKAPQVGRLLSIWVCGALTTGSLFRVWLCKGLLLPGVRPGLWRNLGLWGKPPIHQKTPLLQPTINSLKEGAPTDLSTPTLTVPEVFPNSLLSLEDWRYGVRGRGFGRLFDRKSGTS